MVKLKNTIRKMLKIIGIIWIVVWSFGFLGVLISDNAIGGSTLIATAFMYVVFLIIGLLPFILLRKKRLENIQSIAEPIIPPPQTVEVNTKSVEKVMVASTIESYTPPAPTINTANKNTTLPQSPQWLKVKVGYEVNTKIEMIKCLDCKAKVANYVEICNNCGASMLLTTGRTFAEQQKLDLLKAKEYKKNSQNPKHHRTEDEEELKTDFMLENSDIIEEMEEEVYSACFEVRKIKVKKLATYEIETAISCCKNAIDKFETMRVFCYNKGEGGMLYFQDMWEHCHNSKKACFCFIDDTVETLSKLNDLLKSS